MARGFLLSETAKLKDEIIEMSKYVEKAVDLSIDALKTMDVALAHEVMVMEDVIDHQRFDVEAHCQKLIATQQPVAKDLRTIMSTFSIATDLERIGDHANDIARIVCDHANEPLLKPLIDIPRMTEVALGMLRDALTSLINEDSDLAIELCERDSIVDALCDQVFRELLLFMMADPKTVTRATYLLLAAQHVERIADLATNIAERTLYITTGRYAELNGHD